MRILLVEDEPKMAAALARGLRHQGYAVDTADTGPDALFQARVNDYDAVVLDVMLPGLDGFEVCDVLRREDCWAPVLMLTARDQVSDRIRGLDGRRRLPGQAVLLRRAAGPPASAAAAKAA